MSRDLSHPRKKRENAKVEVFKADGKGMGLRLLEPAAKGQFIAEYVGEVRPVRQAPHTQIHSACCSRQKVVLRSLY